MSLKAGWIILLCLGVLLPLGLTIALFWDGVAWHKLGLSAGIGYIVYKCGRTLIRNPYWKQDGPEA